MVKPSISSFLIALVATLAASCSWQAGERDRSLVGTTWILESIEQPPESEALAPVGRFGLRLLRSRFLALDGPPGRVLDGLSRAGHTHRRAHAA